MLKLRKQSEWVTRLTTAQGGKVYYQRTTGRLYEELPEVLEGNQEAAYTSESFLAYAPLRVYFDFTYRCNFECKHCITSSSPHVDTKGELPTERILELASELAAIGVLELQTSGGEPFAHPDWEQICRHIVGLGMGLIITTNGSLIRPELAETLSELQPTEVRVSFDGGPQLHDHVRGEQAYRKAINGIRLLAQAGINTTARMTLCNGADEELPVLFADLAEAGARRIKIALVKPTGRAATESGAHLLRPLPEQDEVTWLIELGRQHGLEVQLSADDFPVSYEETNDPKLRDLERKNCGAGFETAYISPKGELLGCVAIPNLGFGELHKTSFLEAWRGNIAETYRRMAMETSERRLCDALCNGCGNKGGAGNELISLEG